MEFASATKNTLILTGFIVLLILVVIYLIVRLVKSEKRKNNLELKYNELERKVNNLQLENLESKLNPHLFKNVLNTIQSHAYQTYFALDEKSFLKYLDTGAFPPPDLIVRTGGDIRHSGYFLYQAEYSEYYFTDTLWPDFQEAEFDASLKSLRSAKRNFGK